MSSSQGSEQPNPASEPGLGAALPPWSEQSAATLPTGAGAATVSPHNAEAERRLAVLLAEVEQLAPQLSQTTLRATAARIQALAPEPTAQQDASPAQPMQR